MMNHILTEYRRLLESVCTSVRRRMQSRDGCILGKSTTSSLTSRYALSLLNPSHILITSQVISVITQALNLCGQDPMKKSSIEFMETTPPYFLCGSCPSRIVINFHQLVSRPIYRRKKDHVFIIPQIGHCHRHEAMAFSLLHEEEALGILIHPLEVGLVKKVNDSSRKAGAVRAAQVFGCRHCAQALPAGTISSDKSSSQVNASAGSISRSAEDHSHVVSGGKRSQRSVARPKNALALRARDWNALRSHLKAKYVHF